MITDGIGTNVIDLQEQYAAEYEGLSQERKDEIIAEYKGKKETETKAQRPTARGKVMDVGNTVRNMQQLVRVWNCTKYCTYSDII